MKLYIWHNPYRVDYGMSMLIVVAETLENAKRQAANGDGYAYGSEGGNHPFSMTLGDPTRIVDLPCAEWHMWSE